MAHEKGKAEQIERLLDLGEGLELWRVHIDALREQDRNARVMTPRDFERLTANIKADKRLESLPFCAARTVKGKSRLEVVSGHHRIRASRAAGLIWLHVLVDTTEMPQDAVWSKQLSHNALSGEDDIGVVAAIFADIQDVELQLASGIDPNDVGLGFDAPNVGGSLSLGFDYKQVMLSFLPHQVEAWERLIELLDPKEEQFVARDEQWGEFQRAVNAVQKEMKISSISVTIAVMVEAALEKVEKLRDERKEADDGKE